MSFFVYLEIHSIIIAGSFGFKKYIYISEVKTLLDARTCSGKVSRARTSSGIRTQIIEKLNGPDNYCKID